MVLLGPLCPRTMLDYKVLATRGRDVEFQISKISRNNAAGCISREEHLPNSRADANFNALQRRRGHV